MLPRPDCEADPIPDCATLARRIQAGDEGAETALIEHLQRGLRFVVARRLGRGVDVEDVCQETLIAAISGIRAGRLQDPERVLGYINAICRRKVWDAVQRRVADRSTEPIDERTRSGCTEQMVGDLERRERIDIVKRTLSDLNPRHSEILTRYYLHEQTAEQICAEMHLSDNQFRSIKSRALVNLANCGKRMRRSRSGLGGLREKLAQFFEG